MNSKIVEILVQVLQWIGDGQQDQGDIRAMIEDVLQGDFDQSDIQMLLGWVQERLSNSNLVYDGQPLHAESHRVLHSMESNSIRQELFRFLMELKQRQIISSGELESLIDRALVISWQDRSLDELKDFVNHLLLGRDQLEINQQHRFVLTPGTELSH